MKMFLSKWLCALSATLCVSYGAAGDSIYNPRHIDRICPPEYPETRRWIEGFVRVSHMGGRLRQIFGSAAPASMAEVELLNDKDDRAACQHFARQYDNLINTQVRVFDGAEAWYLHDISFYKGGDFYFVAIGGGFIVDTNPENPDQEAAVFAEVDGVEVFYKGTFEFVDWESMEAEGR